MRQPWFTIEDTQDIVKALLSVLDRIISPTNGPYVIIGWTKTPSPCDEAVIARRSPAKCVSREFVTCSMIVWLW